MNFSRITTIISMIIFLVVGQGSVRAAYGGMYVPRGAGVALTPLDAATRDIRQLIQNAQELYAAREDLGLMGPISHCLTNLTQKANRLLAILGSFERSRTGVRNTVKDEFIASSDAFNLGFTHAVIDAWGDDAMRRKAEGMKDVLLPNIQWAIEQVYAGEPVDEHAGHGDGVVVERRIPHHDHMTFLSRVGRLFANGVMSTVSFSCLLKVIQMRNANYFSRAAALGLGALCGYGVYYFTSNGWSHLKALWQRNAIRRALDGVFVGGDRD